MKRIIACIKNNKYYILCKITSWGFVPLMFYCLFLFQGGFQDLIERYLIVNIVLLRLLWIPLLLVWLISAVFMLSGIIYCCKNEHDENMFKTDKVTVSDLINVIVILISMFFCVMLPYRLLLGFVVEIINYG